MIVERRGVQAWQHQICQLSPTWPRSLSKLTLP